MAGLGLEILSNDEMRQADRLTIKAGLSGEALMETAGSAVAEAILARWPADEIEGPVLILCGPGNNGGDGFVIARLLENAGVTVDVRLLGALEKLQGDAAIMASLWTGEVTELVADEVAPIGGLIVDALFGTGLSRPLDDRLCAMIDRISASGSKVISVDIPSGVDGDSGEIMGNAFKAALTVTFFRKKIGHLMGGGVAHLGELIVRDIGIQSTVLADFEVQLFENEPALWLDRFPWPARDAHKYSRGHAIVMSGGEAATGAARLAAYAALRSGAGLVTIGAPPGALSVIASQIASVMVREVPDAAALQNWLADDRITSVLIGPGNGVTKRTKDCVLGARAASKNLVLDADALTVFEDDPDLLFGALNEHCVLTPHEGEYRRLFNEPAGTSKIERAQRAAARSGAVVLLKGPETIIANPSGETAINVNGTPWLATAGAGDVLGGIIVGLMAQGMPSFEAACAGAWIHGAAGNLFGPGLIAEDLVEAIPDVLAQLF